jgi:hypothetical protein
MGGAEDFNQHVDECPKCIEQSPGKWDLCERGQQLLSAVPTEDLPKTHVK